MINKIIKDEEETITTLKIVVDLINEHDYLYLKCMIEPLNKIKTRSELASLNLHKWNKNNDLGEEYG